MRRVSDTQLDIGVEPNCGPAAVGGEPNVSDSYSGDTHAT